jgi:hypothetical protein
LVGKVFEEMDRLVCFLVKLTIEEFAQLVDYVGGIETRETSTGPRPGL